MRLLLLALVTIPLTQGFAQTDRPSDASGRRLSPSPIANQFEHLSVEDGLSNNSVTAILQDQDGYMWFGTNEGLNKYDGSVFTVFKPNPRQPAQSFQNSVITGLCAGDSGRIWAITEGGGLHDVNPRTGLVTPHPIRADRASRWNNQVSIYRDEQRRLWISTFAGLARYEPARHHFTLYPSPNADGQVVTVLEDHRHRFWVATLRGLYLLNRATGRFTPVPVTGLRGQQPFFVSLYEDEQGRLWAGTATAGYSLFRITLRHQVWYVVPYNPGGQLNPYVWRNTIHRDSTGIVWVGTTTGLQAIDPVSDRVFTYQTDAHLTKSLASNNAQAVYHDRAGTLWVGTDNGIDRQAVETKPFHTLQVTPNERVVNRRENSVNALIRDSHDQLWFSNQFTLYRTSTHSQRLIIVPPQRIGSTGNHQNYLYTFFPDGPAGIWLGTNDGLYHFDQQSGQYTGYASEVFVQYISRAPNGDLWVGGDGGIASVSLRNHQFTYYKPRPGSREGLPDKYVNGLLASRTGDIWVIMKRLGIYRLNPKTGRFAHYAAGPKGHLTTNDIQSIYEDAAGIIWIGTHLGGLNRFDPATGLFSVISPSDGLPGNTVLGITSDARGQLWLSTDKGLCRIDPKTRAIHRYDMLDGLPSNSFQQNAVSRQGDQLFFGSINGLVQFKPAEIRDDTRPFPVYITELTVLDTPRPLTDSVIHLRHHENMLSFGFTALAYEHPEQNQYAYQLVGVNPNWVQSGNRHVATYNSLAPGTYTFRVKAANSDGFWSKQVASVRVIVQPPWWATWWANGLYVLLAGGAVWGYIRFYTNQIRQRQEQDLNRRQAEQLKAVDELKSRFFANITHEFRTPLSLIMAPVEKLLQESRFDRPILTLVHHNAGRLLRLINQLLDLSKLEGHYMTVSLMQGDAAVFIDHTVAIFRRSAEQKNVTLTCVVADLPPQVCLFDADKWEKILTNLLSNALKFTPTGSRVAVTGTPVWTAGLLAGVQIQVADSGIGVTPEQLPYIFDRFYQADSSSTRAYDGTGIGLALVKELTDLLGGTIAVESRFGTGTIFQVTLPVQPVSTAVASPVGSWSAAEQAVAPPLAVPVPDPSADQSGPRILVVEDNEELREFLASELSGSYQVLQAVDGEAGWLLTQTELPDVVLTDVMMPRMDGNALTRCIKSHADTNHIAVVMLTARAAQQSRITGLEQGADDYLSKPFSIDELRLRIQNLITRQQKLGDYYRQRFALSDSRPPAEVAPDPFLQRIYALLENHLDDPTINVDWLADRLAMNRKTLYRKLQSLIQLPPADLIRQYRLRKAADLLRAGRNVSETADLVGFNTASHFALVFKEFYQKTPSEFITDALKKA